MADWLTRVRESNMYKLESWDDGDPSPMIDDAATTLAMFEAALDVIRTHPDAQADFIEWLNDYATQQGWKEEKDGRLE